MLTIKNINKYLLLVVGINDFKILRKPKLILLMTQVTESGGRQNIYSIEPRPQVDPNYVGYPEDAEKVNGRWAMLGIVALFGAYATTWSNYSRYGSNDKIKNTGKTEDSCRKMERKTSNDRSCCSCSI